ncbi:MAG: flagellar hook protein FlgE [Acidobacteriota bacterium]
MINFQSPLSGIKAATEKLDRTAGRIAHVSDPTGDTVDLSAEAVNLMQARTAVAANVKVAQTYDQLEYSILDMLV